MRVSVVIPTLNEAVLIAEALRRLARQGAVVIDSPPGRGVQQNRGAAAASGEVLVFLHADCRLEDGAIAALRRFLENHPRVVGGCFRMRVEAEHPLYRGIDWAAHLRAGLLGIPYGDQGLFVRRRAFDQVGGFPEVPLMEDVGLARRLRLRGRLAVLPARVFVSPRRWVQQGIVVQTLRNWALTAAAAAGVPAATLARRYPPVR